MYFSKGANESELAALQVYFGKSNCNCYKLSLVIDLSYFVGGYFYQCEVNSLPMENNLQKDHLNIYLLNCQHCRYFP